MDVLEFADRLELSRNTKEALKGCSLSDVKKQQMTDLLFPENVEVQTVFENCSPIECLLICLWSANEMRERYEDVGLPEKFFWDNLKDITIWSEDFEKKNGRPGLSEYEWITRTLRLKLFRIGRLQYEPKQLQESINIGEKSYLKGTPILMIHIPAGEPLDYEQVKASNEEAIWFFRAYFHACYPLIYCRTWLLAPEILELLPDNSRIRQFQSLFHFVRSYEDPYRQAEERIFGGVLENVALYPERTTLQRNLKNHLFRGGCTYRGVGVIQIPEY